MEIENYLWEGKIPVRIDMKTSEILSTTSPLPFYDMIPRQGYITKIIDLLLDHFQNYITPTYSKSKIWFEYDGIPLRWHIPFGVLYDLYMEEKDILPWNITIRFLDFPDDKIFEFDENDGEKNYMHSLKQSCYLKYGTTNHVMNVPHHDQLKIWKSIQTGDFQLYKQSIQNMNLDSNIRHIPIRFMFLHEPFLQFPIKSNEWDEESTLNKLLDKYMEDLFQDENKKKISFKIQGIDIPIDVSFVKLYNILCHPDGFLYICIIQR